MIQNKYILYYKQLCKDNKLKITLAAIRNNIRINCNDQEAKYIMMQLQDSNLKDNIKYENIIQYIDMKNIILLDHIYLHNWKWAYIYIYNRFFKECKKNKLWIMIYMNCFCYQNDILPLIGYAFNNYLLADYINEENIAELVELSAHYLFRTIKNIQITDTTYSIVKEGGYSVSYKKDNLLYKYPRNYASKLFSNRNEWETYKILKHTDIKAYIPHYYTYISNTSVIVKEYISGENGGDILKIGITTEQIEALRTLYYAIVYVIKQYHLNLDLHPDNFVWNEKLKKWYFIDVGPIPHIGSDYYILDDFEKYYIKSWRERYIRMKKHPIRSVLIEEQY